MSIAVPVAPMINEERIEIYFIVLYRKGIKFCYERLFKIQKIHNSFVLQYQEDLLKYSIPIFKDNSVIVNIK